MRKLFFLLLLSFLFIPHIFVVSAQEITPLAQSETSANMQWFCLAQVSSDPGEHTAILKVKDGVTIQDTNTYPVSVVVRIAYDHEIDGVNSLTAENSGMTTADEGLDSKILGGISGLTELRNQLGFQDAGIVDGTNPTTSFPITWKDHLTKTSGGSEDRAHYWYGVQEAPVVEAVAAGEGGGNQFGTFTFESAGGAKDCAIIRWDPFGYVFDAITHGPVAGVSVRLLSSKTANGTFTPVPVGVGKGMVGQNPILTQKDGSYRFYVDPGYYKLEIAQYSIEGDSTKIKSGYEDFGYEQLYLAETPAVIHEQEGKVERRDIAIKTIGAPAPFASGPQLKDILVSREEINGKQRVRIVGMVTQIPVTLTALYTDTQGAVVGETKYDLNRSHTFVPTGLHDKRNFDIWVPAVNSQNTGIFKELKITSPYSSKTVMLPIHPMPSYLNGIAQTKSGVPIVGGTVEVVPLGVTQPSYTTQTDSEGRFEVPTAWIPPLPYELIYKTSSGVVTKISTTEYLKQNETLHIEEKIDSFGTNPVKSDKVVSKKNRNTDNILLSGRVQPSVAPKERGISTNGMQGVVMIGVVILVLLFVGVGAVIMIKQRRG